MITKESKALNERKAVLWLVRAISYLVYFYLIVVEIILFIGFFLLLFGANPSAGFTEWAYRNLDRVMDPFRGIFSPIEIGTTSADVPATFDTSVLFAMIIYGIVAVGFSVLIGWLSRRLRQIHSAEDALERDAEREAELERQRAEAAERQAALEQAAADQLAAGQAASAPAARPAPSSDPVAPTPPAPLPPSKPRPPAN